MVAGSVVVGWTLLSAVRAVILPGVRSWPSPGPCSWRCAGCSTHRPPARSYEDATGPWPCTPRSRCRLARLVGGARHRGLHPRLLGLGVDPLRQAFEESGSSLLTLGFVAERPAHTTVAAFVEATIGLGLIALLISYLPSIYSRLPAARAGVVMLETRAGQPPEPAIMIMGPHPGRLDSLHDVWVQWGTALRRHRGETHQPALAAVLPLTGTGALVGDGLGLRPRRCRLILSVVNQPRSGNGPSAFAPGSSLRRIADYFQISTRDPIRTTRSRSTGPSSTRSTEGWPRSACPCRADREKAWRDFQGWRVNYDLALLGQRR